jgi:hypothetical protein
MKKLLQLSAMFLVAVCFGQTPIIRTNFDNDLNVNGNVPNFTFIQNGGQAAVNYIQDRFSTPSKAMRLTNPNYLESDLTTLPIGNNSRSISFWMVNNDTSGTQRVFSYGSAANNQAFGFTQTSTTSTFYGFGNDLVVNFTPSQGSWTFYTLTFDNVSAKIYIDGNLVGTRTQASTWSTAAVTNFKIGKDINNTGGTNISLDDLKIFNTALTATEVTSLFSMRDPRLSAHSSLAFNSNANFNSINFNFNVNPGGQPTKVELYYGTSANSLANNILIQPNVNTTQDISYTLSGLTAGTTYFYQLTLSNDSGFVTTTVNSFVTLTQPAPFSTSGLVAYYGFENNNNNGTGQNNLVNVSGTSNYTAGVVGQALNCTQTITSEALYSDTLANTITINPSRYTVCYWMQSGQQDLQFPTTLEMFGSTYIREQIFAPTQLRVGTSNYAGNFIGNGAFGANQNAGFVHVALVHNDGTSDNCRVYINGVAAYVIPGGLATQTHRYNNRIFVGGGSLNATGTEGESKRFTGKIDEMYVYNRALTQAEVLGVKNNTTAPSLSTNDFNTNNLKFSMFPNPANDILNIEMDKELQSLEIYTLQGQKVFSGNDKTIDIANLSTGMYIVRIQDVDGAIAAQRLVKK